HGADDTGPRVHPPHPGVEPVHDEQVLVGVQGDAVVLVELRLRRRAAVAGETFGAGAGHGGDRPGPVDAADAVVAGVAEVGAAGAGPAPGPRAGGARAPAPPPPAGAAPVGTPPPPGPAPPRPDAQDQPRQDAAHGRPPAARGSDGPGPLYRPGPGSGNGPPA